MHDGTRLMDILSIIGVLVSVGALLLGNLLEGGEIGSLINGPALIIVFGGTFGATLLQFPPVIFIRSLKMFLWIFKPRKMNLEAQISQNSQLEPSGSQERLVRPGKSDSQRKRSVCTKRACNFWLMAMSLTS